MKNIKLYAFLLLLIGCGRAPDLIEMGNSVFPNRTLNFSYADKEIDSYVRSVTLLNFPDTSEIGSFTYEIEEEKFNQVFGAIPNTNRVPHEVGPSLNSFQKVQTMTYLVLRAGDARDKGQVEIEKTEKKIESVKETLSNILGRHPCYKIKSGPNRRKCKAYADEETDDEARVANTCDQLSRWIEKGDFVEYSDEDMTRAQNDINECNSAGGSDLASLENYILEQTTMRETAKGIVLEMLHDAEEHTGELYVATAATKSDKDEVTYLESHVQMNADRSAFTEFSLAIDFGIGKGFEVYSLENGRIQNFSFEKRSDGVEVLRFSMDNGVYRTDAELSTTVADYFDLRFAGETTITLKNGKKRKGVMKIELDFN